MIDKIDKMPDRPRIKIPEPNTETIACPHCGKDIGLEKEVEWERRRQRDHDAAYYEPLIEQLQDRLALMQTMLNDKDGAITDLKSLLEMARNKVEQEGIRVAREIFEDIEKQFPEVKTVTPVGTYEHTMKILRDKIDKWQSLKSKHGGKK